MKPITICIVGTHQCGITKLSNLIRLMYEIMDKNIFCSWKIESSELSALMKKKNYDAILCKVHDTSNSYLKKYNVVLLATRNVLDSALSGGEIKNDTSAKFYIKHCKNNIRLYNKFKAITDFIFRYENYNIQYITILSSLLNIKLSSNQIVNIMNDIDKMHPSNLPESYYTTDGKLIKNTYMPKKKLKKMLKDETISKFLKEHSYIECL